MADTDDNEPNEEMDQFTELTRELLKVRKKELDERRAKSPPGTSPKQAG